LNQLDYSLSHSGVQGVVMGIFGKKLPGILEDPMLVELYSMLQSIQAKSSAINDNTTKEEILSLIHDCDAFDLAFQTQLPKQFMLRVNHEDFSTYRYIQSWLMDVNGIKTHNLGSYMILWAYDQKGAKKDALQKEYERVTSGLHKSSYRGEIPTLKSALSYHNIDLDKLA
jgi:hypothetical protein